MTRTPPVRPSVLTLPSAVSALVADRLAWIWVIGAYTLISAAMTWPLLRHPASRLGGDQLDPWQTLWGFWWWRQSLTSGQSPFTSPLLWWPDGIPLWFQTFDIPAAAGTLLLSPWLPPIALHNIALFLSFPLAGFTFYLLSRELWGGRLAPFLSGCLYTFSAFHFGYAQHVLHVASIQWSPLFFFALARLKRAQPWGRTAVLAGVALSLATMASVYHLAFCIVATAIGVLWNFWTRCFGSSERQHHVSQTRALQLASVVGVYLVLTGWLLLGMILEYRSEPYSGGHNAIMFSADLQSFIFPNAVSRWSEIFPQWRSWELSRTLPIGESGAYVGYTALALALIGSYRDKSARPYLAIAVAGVILSMGPYLQIGGVGPHVQGNAIVGIALPFKWLTEFVPGLAFSGMPVRFTWLVTFGVAVAAGACLARICRLGGGARIAAVVLTAVALIEVWPRPFTTSAWPRPSVLVDWSKNHETWAVLDATGSSRPLWHQTLHHHPIVGGYTTRWPKRLVLDLQRDEAVRPFFRPPWGRKIREPLSIAPAVARERLRELKIRFVIVDDTRTDLPAGMGLREFYRGEGMVIYELPEPSR